MATIADDQSPDFHAGAIGAHTQALINCIRALERSDPAQTPLRLAEKFLRFHRRMTRLLGYEMTAMPGIVILFDLYVAGQKGRQVSISSLCIGSGVPSTTALRWMRQMRNDNLLLFTQDKADGRRSWVGLTELGQKQAAALLSMWD